MKKLFIIAALTLITLTEVNAQTLEAKSFKGLVELIKKSEFSYKEKGMIFGYVSTQSCLFVSKDIAIFKNYCFPVKEYPAKGFTIISKEYGMIDIYEENLPSGILKHDVLINQFPEVLAPYLSTAMESSTLDGLNDMIEKLYYQYNPACWSTN